MKGFYKSGLSGQDLQVIGFDKHEINSLLRNLDTIAERFNNTKLKKIARSSAKPLRTEMKNLAPKNTKKRNWVYYGKGETRGKKKRYKYKAGTLKRSIAIFNGKKGVFIAPRIGKINKSVRGQVYRDGYYAHIVIQKSKKGKNFIEKARLNKRQQVISNMVKEAKTLVKW